jgi:hypothetical protein
VQYGQSGSCNARDEEQMMSSKTLTMKQLAQLALDAQSTTSLPPLVHYWADFIGRLQQLNPGTHADPQPMALNRHPINVLFASRLAELAGATSQHEITQAFYACKKIVEDE